jgi:chemotaxis family two-component system response regulator Rcp1
MPVDKHVRIILAEDNPGDVFLVRRALEKKGIAHELIVAVNGEEAMHLLQHEGPGAEAPQLILLDLNLPKLDGNQILSRIRRMPAFDRTPVIVLTSSDSRANRDRAFALGANAFFSKPTDLASLVQLGDDVERTLNESAA